MSRHHQANNLHDCPSKQRGAALMVMLVIMVMGSAAFMVSSLSSSSIKNARQETTSAALAQAKEALIGYAVSNATRPGNLPCPDRKAPSDINYGSEDSPCSAGGGTTIGRLPWKSLGIPELVDADGEPLWYAISDNFRKSVSSINSDTAGTLDVYDNDGVTLLTPTGSKAVAVVFAPGSPITGQSRSASQSALCTTTNTNIALNRCSTNYLDAANGRNNATAGGPFIAANKTDTFNDRMIFITADQLFPAIEKRVGKEVEIGIKSMLNAYYTAWGAFPFAAGAFPPNPSTSTFTGQSATYNGLLPVGNIVNLDPSLSWATIPAPTISGGGGATCTISSNTRLRCGSTSVPVDVPAGGTVTITGNLIGVGFGLWKIFDKEILTEVRFRVPSSSSTNRFYYDTQVNLTNVNITGSLNVDGSATIVLTATANSGGATLSRIEMRDIQSSSTAPLALWLLPNNWHQLAYYAASQGYAPGGINSCEPLGTLPHIKPYCLTVNGTGGGNDKRAVVVMMNKALTGKTHTTNNLADYLEGENATPADFIYENKTRSSTFNDQVIIVAP